MLPSASSLWPAHPQFCKYSFLHLEPEESVGALQNCASLFSHSSIHFLYLLYLPHADKHTHIDTHTRRHICLYYWLCEDFPLNHPSDPWPYPVPTILKLSFNPQTGPQGVRTSHNVLTSQKCSDLASGIQIFIHNVKRTRTHSYTHTHATHPCTHTLTPFPSAF